MNDAALIVIDMQNDFCDPNARLFVAGAPSVVDNIGEVMRSFRAAGAPVIVVLRQHRSAGVDVDHTRIGIFSEDPFLVTSPGTDIVDGLEIKDTDVVVVKRRWSAFFATDLDMVLRRVGVHSVVLAGVQTPNCIRATANDATSLDYHCLVISDATASATPAIQAANLADMAQMGVEIISTAEVSARCGILETTGVS